MHDTQSSARLLAIDDSSLIHRLLKARLRHEPLEIHGALDGQAGIDAALALDPDVILLDLHLPDLDGFAVLRELKAEAATRDIPVLIVSSSWETEDKVRGFELGAIDFITKPFEVAELRARVYSAVRLRSLIKMLAQKAQLDGLTGLWNRTYFDGRLEQEIKLARRHDRQLTLIMCDVDHFKSLNDNWGHPFGDHVLEAAAKTLTSAARTSDVVCRYGGEEFAIILPETASDSAKIVAERQREGLAALEWSVGDDLRVTASFGLADLATVDGSMEALVKAADEALYASKEGGRNRVTIAPGSNDLRLSA